MNRPTVTKLSCIQAHRVFRLRFAWCSCMAINDVSVRYNKRWVSPRCCTVDPTLLRPAGNSSNAIKRFCRGSLCSHLNVLTFSPLSRLIGSGMLRRFGCIQIFHRNTSSLPPFLVTTINSTCFLYEALRDGNRGGSCSRIIIALKQTLTNAHKIYSLQ